MTQERQAWAKGGQGEGFRGALRNILLAGIGLPVGNGDQT